MKRVVKTPGQRYFEETYPKGLWSSLSSSDHETFEVKATRLGIQPIEEDVPDPPKTDGELLQQAYHNTRGWDAYAAEFLRLRAERDGEPLEVTADMVRGWLYETKGPHYIAQQINAHRGVRSLPKVTEACNSNGVLHTFEFREDAIAFRKTNDWSSAWVVDGWLHHAKAKDG